MIDMRSEVAKNIVARMAVARESAFACPRPVMKLPVPPPDPERAALGALQEHDGDQGDDDEDMDDDQDGLHEGGLERSTGGPPGFEAGALKKMARSYHGARGASIGYTTIRI